MPRTAGPEGIGSSTLGGSRFGPKSKRDLIERSTDIRKFVERRRLASAEEIRSVWPAKGKRSPLYDWVYCYAQLVRFNGREDRTARHSIDLADQIAIDALADVPAPVILSSGTCVEVHPKSWAALRWFQRKDRMLAFLDTAAERIHAAIEEGRVEAKDPTKLLADIDAESARLMAEILAQACQPGAALVSGLDTKKFEDLPPSDLIRIHDAYVEVNAQRLIAVRQMIATRPHDSDDPGGLRWAVNFSFLGEQWGLDPRELIERKSLASVMSRAMLAAPPQPVEAAG